MPTDVIDACVCGAPVEGAYQRHATQAEYDAPIETTA